MAAPATRYAGFSLPHIHVHLPEDHRTRTATFDREMALFRPLDGWSSGTSGAEYAAEVCRGSPAGRGDAAVYPDSDTGT